MNNAQRKRMKEASDSLSNAIAIIEEVRDEEQTKLDNTPDSLQNTARYDMMQMDVDRIEDILDSLNGAETDLDDFLPPPPKRKGKKG